MSVLYDAHGRKIDTGSLKKEISRPTVAGIRSPWSGYPSRGLTPGKLATILKEADSGDIYRQMELFEEMEEKDAHIYSCLQTRKLALVGKKLEIVEASEDKKDKEIAEFVRTALKRIENLEDALMDLMDAVSKGFAASEILWQIENGKYYIQSLEWRHQKWFTYDEVAQDLRLLTDEEPSKGSEIPPYKFVIHRMRAKSGSGSRAGLIRIVAWMYLFKNYAIKDWVAFCEVFGMPLRLGKYPSGATPEDRDILLAAVTQLGQDAAAIIPEGMSIDFITDASTSGADRVYESLGGFANREISKAILGQTLTTEVGDKGAYAASQTHQLVRQDLLAADNRSFCSTFKRDIVVPIVTLNYGPQEAYPEPVISIEPPEDLKTLAERDKILVDAGMRIPSSYAHTKYGIPEPKDGESILTPPAARQFAGKEPVALKEPNLKKKFFLTRAR